MKQKFLEDSATEFTVWRRGLKYNDDGSFVKLRVVGEGDFSVDFNGKLDFFRINFCGKKSQWLRETNSGANQKEIMG